MPTVLGRSNHYLCSWEDCAVDNADKTCKILIRFATVSKFFNSKFAPRVSCAFDEALKCWSEVEKCKSWPEKLGEGEMAELPVGSLTFGGIEQVVAIVFSSEIKIMCWIFFVSGTRSLLIGRIFTYILYWLIDSLIKLY